MISLRRNGRYDTRILLYSLYEGSTRVVKRWISDFGGNENCATAVLTHEDGFL